MGQTDDKKPITQTIENWTAPDLGISTDFRTTDPMRGESRIQLVNIKRGEPDPMLFQIPADYRILDQ
jgi:hypothetical protein